MPVPKRNFARQMTEFAHGLGMGRTVFRNATGLPNNDHQVTTAHDMAVLAMALLRQFPSTITLQLAQCYHRQPDLPTVNGIPGS